MHLHLTSYFKAFHSVYSKYMTHSSSVTDVKTLYRWKQLNTYKFFTDMLLDTGCVDSNSSVFKAITFYSK